MSGALDGYRLADMKQRYGSFRKLIEAYWMDKLTLDEELLIEDKFPRETLVDYKPVTR